MTRMRARNFRVRLQTGANGVGGAGKKKKWKSGSASKATRRSSKAQGKSSEPRVKRRPITATTQDAGAREKKQKRKKPRRGVGSRGRLKPTLMLDEAQAKLVLANYREVHHDRVFDLGSHVRHARRGTGVVVTIEVRGGGGWDRIDYAIKLDRRGRLLRVPVMGAADKGLRAI